jgi:hypothetical protein
MSNRRRAQFLFSVFVATGTAALCGACSSRGDGEERGALERRAEAAGTLRLPLVTRSNAAFRLRNAVFEVSNVAGTMVVLDSEADPDAEKLEVELDQGEYAISLLSGWSLERIESDGGATAVHAALLTPNPSTFSIRHERVTALTYAFATESAEVSFGEGSARIVVDVSAGAPASGCDVRSASGCSSGQTCLLDVATGETYCATPGTLPVGSPCSSEQCVQGAQCMDAGDGQALCRRFCDPSSSLFGCSCRSLSVSEGVGVCEDDPVGACDLFTQTGCAEGEACQYQGGTSGTCGIPGGGAVGASCLGETCLPGLECHGDEPELGFTGTCARFCDTRVGGCGYVSSPWYSYTYCHDTGRANLGLCLR